MASLLYSELDALHREKADFVYGHISPMLAAARKGYSASYETDGFDEYVCLQLGCKVKSVNVTGDNLWGILVDVAKVIRKL